MTRRRLLLGGAAVALQAGKLDEAVRLITEQTASGQVAAVSIFVRDKSDIFQQAFGKAPNADAVFLLASITKPMTATAVLKLADRRELSLADPVHRFLPEFRGEGREGVLIRHLLTHTSGLPDMLPENDELRKRHAPLSAFVEATFRTPLLFAPGSEVRYQSMGILLASEIVARVTKQRFPEFLREHLFLPLGMRSASLGLGARTIAETMQCQVDEVTDWDWNSAYWRNLGAPWGGAHSDAADIGRLLDYFARPDARVLKPETARAMTTLQTPGLKGSWGYGWSLTGGRFGHSGSTGTLCWHDPANDRTFVLLTTKPAAHSGKTLITPVSDRVASA